ncbi:MAG: NAD(P)/FAD-dependent oxidoreductase, partial [Firmicutes bacterium]|nr:NAD(P)/FAD-dependent oxidoreductase [Bacillota bacterium]
MPDQLFDIIFLGGGPAGYQGAIRSAQLGQRVAVVENRELGGVCLNRGCIPTKTIKASVDLLLRARQAKSYGLEIDNVRPNIEAIIARKDKVVGLLRGGIEQLFRAHKVVLYQGCGRFLSPREIQVEMKDARVRLTADKIVIATGSRTFIPSQFAGMLPGLITSDEILDLTAVPSSLIIVGAGAIGVEMASIMAGLGSEVTVVEMQERILPTEDLEMVSYLLRMLKRQKIKIITGVTVADFRPGTRVQVSLSNGQALEADAVLVAAGRIPNTDAIGLEAAGLATHSGFLKVNEQMETEVNGIYAAGDVVGGWLLAHVA